MGVSDVFLHVGQHKFWHVLIPLTVVREVDSFPSFVRVKINKINKVTHFLFSFRLSRAVIGRNPQGLRWGGEIPKKRKEKENLPICLGWVSMEWWTTYLEALLAAKCKIMWLYPPPILSITPIPNVHKRKLKEKMNGNIFFVLLLFYEWRLKLFYYFSISK